MMKRASKNFLSNFSWWASKNFLWLLLTDVIVIDDVIIDVYCYMMMLFMMTSFKKRVLKKYEAHQRVLKKYEALSRH